MSCDTNDIHFSMSADIFYSINEQSAYGDVVQSWYHDRTVICNFVYAGAKTKEEVIPNILISQDSLLIGRTKEDVRVSSSGDYIDKTNIVISNIKDKFCNEIYLESGGVRTGKSTLYEIATIKPFINPFGKTEHFSIILKRSENQGQKI